MNKSKWIVASIIGAASLVFFGCSSPSDSTADNVVDKVVKAKVNVNFSNAKYIATTTVTTSTNSSIASRAAAGEKTSLVVINTDGSVNYDAIKLSDDFKASLDSSKAYMHDVLEVYSCDKGEDSNKGTYIVFTWMFDHFKYADGSDAPKMSQVIFVNKEGEVFDVLNDNGNVNRCLATWIKEDNGEEYIRFDNKGNIFMVGHERDEETDTKKKLAIYRWNPTNGLQKYKIDANIDYIRNFAITEDGSWIFINAMLDNFTKDNVYAVEVNSSRDPIALYESKADRDWCVRTISVDAHNRVYFYVNDYNDPANAASGLYIVNKTSSGYSKDNVKRYICLNWNSVNRFIRSILNEPKKKITSTDIAKLTNADYTAILNFIKSFTNYKGEMDFSLEYYKDKTKMPCWLYDDNGNKQYDGFTNISMLYKEDDSGNVLKNEDALKFLIKTESPNKSKNDDDSEFDGETLFFKEFRDECHCTERAHSFKSECGPFPLEVCLVKQGTNNTVFENWELDYLKAEYANAQEGLFISNDYGVWTYNDIFTKTDEKDANDTYIYKQTYALFRNIVDSDGYFKADPYVGSLKNTELYVIDDGLQYGGEYPSKKLPFAANSKAVAAVSKDKKTIYYQEGNLATVNLLANYAKKNEIGAIYSFNMDEDTILLNASLQQGSGYTTLSIDLATKEVTKLSVNKQFDSMVKR